MYTIVTIVGFTNKSRVARRLLTFGRNTKYVV